MTLKRDSTLEAHEVQSITGRGVKATVDGQPVYIGKENLFAEIAGDVALETADVALMADDLNHLPFVVGLSRQTSRIIRQNLWFSLGMVAFLVPATVLGLRLGAAVVLHEGSTLLVVLNALRLLAYRDLTLSQTNK